MNRKHILICILVLAAAFRLYGLSRGDAINDEVLIAFRGLGMMDFDEADLQTTPWEWMDANTLSGKVQLPAAAKEIEQIQTQDIKDIPWWAHLSFHDHPPLAFLIEGFSMNVFGDNAFALRLPSALLGIMSVYLVYAIGALLFSVDTGLVSAALYAVTLNGVYISRTGMQEPYVIFFFLLSSYFFLRSLKDSRYLVWTGIALGFGLLAKYTVFIMAPIFIGYLLFYKREYFSNRKFWIGVLLSILIFSPVLIYNWQLYRAVGHFDFQFSYIFGQNPEAWKVTPGKDIGTLSNRIMNFAPRLIATNSWLFLILCAVSLLSFVIWFIKKPKEFLSKTSFLLVGLSGIILLLFKIGPSYRFLTMLTPFLALVIGVFGVWIFGQLKRFQTLFLVIAGIIVLFESLYAWNNQIAYYPAGPTPWFSSKVRYENYNWGYNELGNYFEKELAGKMPALTFNVQYQFLDKLQEKVLEEDRMQFLTPYPAMIVYYGNFDQAAKLWTLDRLHIYHAWPVISAKTYFEYLQQNGFDYYERSGFKDFYFVMQNNIVPFPGIEQLEQGTPAVIQNKKGEEAFKIYHFSLE